MNANQILQRGGSVLRETVRIGERIGRWVVGQAVGVVQEARHGRPAPKPDMDDVTLARKVETEVFRGRPSVKASVNVNVVDGVVWLRGEVKRPEQIRSLEQKAHSVPEVQGVENLLHLTKTPSPTRADTPRRQQRTRSSTRKPTPRRRAGGRVTEDRTDALSPDAEPSPTEHARTHEGRSPAPFGSTGGEEEATEAAPAERQLPSGEPPAQS